jgi:hypothetical protein
MADFLEFFAIFGLSESAADGKLAGAGEKRGDSGQKNVRGRVKTTFLKGQKCQNSLGKPRILKKMKNFSKKVLTFVFPVVNCSPFAANGTNERMSGEREPIGSEKNRRLWLTTP